MAEYQPDIQVFNETTLSIPLDHDTCKSIAETVSKREKCRFKFLEIVYVDEKKIIQINNEHLNRDYVTDIITFRYDESKTEKDNNDIEGTMFCCAPRIIEQAEEFDEPMDREFKRIYIHGLLHLVGYEDQNSSQKEQMTAKENQYLQLG